MRHKYSIEVFENEDAISYYLLGVWFSDGNISIREGHSHLARLAVNDLDWITDIRNIICHTLPIKARIKDRENPTYSIDISTKEIVDWFICHECLPNKSLTVKLPSCPKEFFPDFLRGLYDGDGWIGIYQQKQSKNKRITCSLSSSSKELIKKLKEKLENDLQIKTGISINKGGERNFRGIISIVKDNYRLVASGANALKLINYMYYKDHKISLSRKNILAKEANVVYVDRDKIESKGNIGLKGVKCKIQWPSDKELIIMIKKCGFIKVAKQLGVSDGAIRKRLKRRNLYSEFERKKNHE